MTGAPALTNKIVPFPRWRPRLEPERDGAVTLVMLGSHGWLCGDRRQALREFAGLVDIERIDNMILRRRLPQRRGAIAVEVEHAGHQFRMQIGCFPDGALGEVFLDATKQNSMLDAFAADAAILLSLLLQYGVLPDEIGHALRRSPNGAPASLIGAVVDELHATERHQDRSAS